jgi:hypothetical protein
MQSFVLDSPAEAKNKAASAEMIRLLFAEAGNPYHGIT